MRLTDLDDLMAALTSAGVYPDAKTSDIIANAPTVDAEPVVRCCDCIECENQSSKGNHFCYYWKGMATKPNGYCWAGRHRR